MFLNLKLGHLEKLNFDLEALKYEKQKGESMYFIFLEQDYKVISYAFSRSFSTKMILKYKIQFSDKKLRQ
ncbi:hypothetical protein D1631_10445 [Chryseobacterium nematophagum]|uniref:Uncharacterized protein n=1 Tax=Chryseobacterium nematophagum TaxID=2305228 RepID=A0A3M7TI39_9FLAO|nr:hypothetical protein D1631_10445 [Chryseobacterium nematophagum]